MISFFVSIVILLAGYFFYSKLIAKLFGVDPERKTPAFEQEDGVDYAPMSTWRVFLVQFLNIAGLGPIFGPIMGIQYGTSAFLWIALGTVFAGGVHDYMVGMLSMRNRGCSLPDIVGANLGKGMLIAMRVFSLALLILLGAVFIINPADLISNLVGGGAESASLFVKPFFWVVVIFVYYLLATVLPVDKIIGRFYPVLGAALLFMAIALFAKLCLGEIRYVPEFTDGLQNRFAEPKLHPVFPMMFISIACGAISGFHATQSPIMARCIKNETHGRLVFYGAMVAEGIVALIWAAATIAYFKGDFSALGGYLKVHSTAAFVNEICNSWLGKAGAILAVLGVVAAPITSGDTALRSARLIVAEFVKVKQDKFWVRILFALPLFALCIVVMNLEYQVLWRYFAACNQILACIALWAISVYFVKEGKSYLPALIPAVFMTMVCSTYVLFAPECFHIQNYYLTVGIAAVVTLVAVCLFFNFTRKVKNLK